MLGEPDTVTKNNNEEKNITAKSKAHSYKPEAKRRQRGAGKEVEEADRELIAQKV